MSETDKLIDSVKEIIGRGDSDNDWKIAPMEHAAVYESKAPLLAKTLRSSKAQGYAEMYTEEDAKADKARNKFKNTMWFANWAVFLTAVSGTFLVAGPGIQKFFPDCSETVFKVIGLTGAVTTALGTMYLKLIRGDELSGRWTTRRSKAEKYRLAFFKTVLAGSAENPESQLQAFEYTRRYLFDNQIDYFKMRGKHHETAADSALYKSVMATFCASLMTAAAGGLIWMDLKYGIVGALGTIATAWGTLVLSRSAIELDRVNAKRYLEILYQLRERKLLIDEYRRKIASGNKDAAQEYYTPVFALLEADHQSFIEDEKRRDLTVAETEKALSEAMKKLKTDVSEK